MGVFEETAKEIADGCLKTITMTVRKISSLAREGEPHHILLFRGLPPSDSPSNDLSPSRELPSPSDVPTPQSLTPRLSTTTNRYTAAGQEFPRSESIFASEAMKLVGWFDMDAGRTSALETVQENSWPKGLDL